MKKSLLLVGAFLTVAAMAQAKEVVPAPIVVTEAPVQIVEKEVIVYRDREPVGFRPNGYVNLYLRYYGETEGQKDKKVNPATDWHKGANNYSRTQLEGKINMTEVQSLYFRVRDYHDWDNQDEVSGKKGTDTKLNYYYKHGNVGDSRVDFTSELEYRFRGDSNDKQHVWYKANFNFADYMFNNDYVKTTDFTVAPYYRYTWWSNDSNYKNEVGIYANIEHSHPWGFATQLEFDTIGYNFYANNEFNKNAAGDYTEDKELNVTINAIISQTTPLYSNEKVSLKWYTDGGFDSYTWSGEKQFGTLEDQAVSYEAKLVTGLKANYAATPFVNLYGELMGEYRNWAVSNEKSATNWRWQPYVTLGVKTTF